MVIYYLEGRQTEKNNYISGYKLKLLYFEYNKIDPELQNRFDDIRETMKMTNELADGCQQKTIAKSDSNEKRSLLFTSLLSGLFSQYSQVG